MISITKTHAPFERLRASNTSPEVSLYKSIILQAMMDACNAGKDKKSRYVKASARTWLLNKSEAFVDTCVNANLDLNVVMKIAKKEIILHENNYNLLDNKKSLDKITLNPIIDYCAINESSPE